MISHRHKCIFIHIPKCAGSSIFKYFHPNADINWKVPNYDVLYGWCPKRKIHLQHATSKQLVETELVTEEQWKTYYKFTVVRNPWDRMYSDYLWIQKERRIKGSFKNYITRKGEFADIFTNSEDMTYRGDHLLKQIDFFDFEGDLKPDAILRFESVNEDMNEVLKNLGSESKFTIHENKSPKKNRKHYSNFYSKKNLKLVELFYEEDINALDYEFDDQSTVLRKVKNVFGI